MEFHIPSITGKAVKRVSRDSNDFSSSKSLNSLVNVSFSGRTNHSQLGNFKGGGVEFLQAPGHFGFQSAAVEYRH